MDNPGGWFRDKQVSQESAPPRSPSPSKQTGSLGRSGTLSWQQRPSSRDSTSSRNRPLSSLAIENAAAKAASTPPQQSPVEDAQMSRSQIAQSLGAKDPTWFRQTADRGIGSAAYRKNQEDTISDTSSHVNNRKLPGLSRESTAEAENASETASEYDRSTLASRASRPTPTANDRYPSISSISSGGLGPPMHAASGQRSDSSIAETTREPSFSNPPAMSPAQSRIGSERPPSPTKGLGGFVQSAMMKRSDSVNKRWSAQPTGGLSRGNSITANRNGVTGLGLDLDAPSTSQSEKSPLDAISDSSETARPTPRNDDKNDVKDSKKPFNADTDSKQDVKVESRFTARPLPVSTSSRSLPTRDLSDANQSHGADSVPTSPSKTMDSRRWSPTKASWLESALNKPGSPQVKSSTPQQPSWVSEIQKTKQARADGDDIKSPKAPHREVQTASLLRSPPMGGHSRPLSISGLPEGFGSAIARSPSPTKMATTTVQDMSEPDIPSQTETSGASDAYIEPQAVPSKGKASVGQEITGTEKAHDKSNQLAKVMASESPEPKPLLKPKPQTPPKTDLRAGLRPRQQNQSDKSNQEPEFKNVFGNLKRTQTKNYVAPDVLKGNILQGKSALNITGGPKKTARVDEFKDSILKQKDAMKAGGGSTLKKENQPPVPKKSSNSIPEALAKRNALGHSDTNKASPTSEPAVRPSWKARTVSQEKSITTSTDKEKPPAPKWSERQSQSSIKPTLPTPSKSDKAPTNEKKEDTVIQSSKFVSEPQSYASSELSKTRTTSSSGSGSSKLADRLNPALLGVLSRGPSPRPKTGTGSADALPTRPAISTKETETEASGASLTHMTKGRARGPKRRMPNAPDVEEEPPTVKRDQVTAPVSKATQASAEVPEPALRRPKLAPRPLADLINSNERIRKSEPEPTSEPELPKESSPVKPKEDVSVDQRQSQQALSPVDKPKPKVVPKSPEIRKVSGQNEKSAEFAGPTNRIQEKQLAPEEEPAIETQTKSQAPTSSRFPGWSSTKPETSNPEAQVPIIASKPGSKPDTKVSQAPPKTSTPKPEVNVSQAPPRALPPTPRGARKPPDRINIEKSISPSLGSAQPALNSPASFSKEDIRAIGKKSPSVMSPKPTLSQPSSSDIFSSFFETSPSASSKIDIDPQNILLSATTPDSIQTTHSQVSSITGDGKLTQMSQNQEYMLHSDRMYLVVHDFSPRSQPSRKETEVYLWTGSAVPTPSIEDAQLFCRKVARENSTKLIHIPSGKETSHFLSALGGVGIFRQTSNRTAESSFYMLRARRHLSHISFDEVPFHPSSLCSGFCYIISAKFGKLYLWKGKGAAADELGTARLIGMNLSLLGEIEEIAEGDEPDSFFESFSSPSSSKDIPLSSVHWSMKSRHDKYEMRLFKIDHSASRRPSSSGGLGSLWGRRTSTSPAKQPDPVTEVTPFTQTDLAEAAVFVLDAWFEIYMYVLLFLFPPVTSVFPSSISPLSLLTDIAASYPPRPSRRAQISQQPCISHKNTLCFRSVYRIVHSCQQSRCSWAGR